MNGRLFAARGSLRADVMRFDLQPPRARSVTEGDFNSVPAVSPVAEHLVFASNRNGSTELWLTKVRGESPKRLTEGLAEIPDTVVWSPDGSALAVAVKRGSNSYVFRVDARSGAMQQLTSGPYRDRDVRFTPDGRWIRFTSDRNGEARSEFAVPASGGDAKPFSAERATATLDETIEFRLRMARQLWARGTGQPWRKLTMLTHRAGLAPTSGGFYSLAAFGNNGSRLDYRGVDVGHVIRSVRLQAARPGISATQDGAFAFVSVGREPQLDLFATPLN